MWTILLVEVWYDSLTYRKTYWESGAVSSDEDPTICVLAGNINFEDQQISVLYSAPWFCLESKWNPTFQVDSEWILGSFWVHSNLILSPFSVHYKFILSSFWVHSKFWGLYTPPHCPAGLLSGKYQFSWVKIGVIFQWLSSDESGQTMSPMDSTNGLSIGQTLEMAGSPVNSPMDFLVEK